MANLRTSIKHSFLKEIIFRIDFSGLLEKDIETCVMNLRNDYFDAGFDNMDKRIENLDDYYTKVQLGLRQEEEISYKKTDQGTVYVFSSNSKPERIEMGIDFLTLTIDTDGENKLFKTYLGILTKTLEQVKNISSYARILRIGLDKYNVCFLKSLSSFPQYFTKAAFNMEEFGNQFDGYHYNVSNLVTILERDGFEINYVRNIQKGVIQQDNGEQQTVYQALLNINVFSDDIQMISNLLLNKDKIEEMILKINSIAFELFEKSLSNSFIMKLKEETFRDTEIIGVN